MRAKPTPAWDAGNHTVWPEYTDLTFVAANGLVLSVTSAVGVAANIFVILAVYHQKSLQTSINALVVNLAIIDILRCVIDCPLLLIIVVAVHQEGRVDKSICDVQVVSFSFSCCIQLLTLACISAERYQAIARPFKTSQRKKRIALLIPLTWTLAIVMAAACLAFADDSPVHISCTGSQRDASASYDTFGLYVLLPLWAACFAVIIGFYARIFTLVRAHNRKIFDKGTFPLPKKQETEDAQKTEKAPAVENAKSELNPVTSPPVAQMEPVTRAEQSSSTHASVPLTSIKAAQSVSRLDKESKNALEITNLVKEHACPPAIPVAGQTGEKSLKTEETKSWDTRVEAKPWNGGAAGRVRSSTTEPQKALGTVNADSQSKENVKINKAPTEVTETSPHVPSPAQSGDPESTSVLLVKPKQGDKMDGGETPAAAADQMSTLPPLSAPAPETDAGKQTVEVEGAICMMPSKASRERANKKKESQMAKRAGYIIVTYLLFWLPLITTILMNFVVHRNKITQINIVQNVAILSVSVSCVTSLSDPIIYAAVNPQFRTEFYRLKNKVKSTVGGGG